jgi:hypothetical protein
MIKRWVLQILSVEPPHKRHPRRELPLLQEGRCFAIQL